MEKHSARPISIPDITHNDTRVVPPYETNLKKGTLRVSSRSCHN